MVELRETAEGGGGIGTGVVVVESPLSNIEAKRDENPRGEGKGDPTIEIGQPEVERPGPQEQGPRKDDEKKASSSGRGHETTEEIEKRLVSPATLLASRPFLQVASLYHPTHTHHADTFPFCSSALCPSSLAAVSSLFCAARRGRLRRELREPEGRRGGGAPSRDFELVH